MPSGTHTVELELPNRTIWNFVADMDRWAPLVPGYIEHEIITDRQSTWKFKGDVGKFQKTIHLKIDITKWQEPNKVTFDLTGLNEKVFGNGYFEAVAVSDHKTKMTGYLDITASGLIKPMANPILKKLVPENVQQLTEAVADTVTEINSVFKVKAK
ncbi:CoxG family protein [Aquibacillus sediminis]|uniref:CoxG family protein n=1 Tax=Aquibacillus sediminis TaxID=2574734 RepID=UPI001109D021|nr:SRPBCC family protein [Aquibacillus sediminis]